MNIKLAILAPTRKRRLSLVVAAGILSAIGTGSILGIAANADPVPVQPTTTSQNDVNLDSLYAAKAAETADIDSSFIVAVAPDKTITGNVSWYGPGFHGRKTASGERFDKMEMTAAHKTLPFGSLVRVVDSKTGKAVLVRINDRGPYCGGRVLDLSEGAATRLGMKGRGTANARLEVFQNVKAQRTQNDAAPAVLTFDGNAQAVMPNGFSVSVGRFTDFDEAAELQYRLAQQGHNDRVYLTQAMQDGRIVYQVCIGLYSTEYLCQSLLAEATEEFDAAQIVQFDQGLPIALNDTSVDQVDL